MLNYKSRLSSTGSGFEANYRVTPSFLPRHVLVKTYIAAVKYRGPNMGSTGVLNRPGEFWEQSTAKWQQSTTKWQQSTTEAFVGLPAHGTNPRIDAIKPPWKPGTSQQTHGITPSICAASQLQACWLGRQTESTSQQTDYNT